MKVCFLLSVLFVFVHYSYGKEDPNKNSIKALIIREIMRKISNVTLNSLAGATDEKKQIFLDKVKQKLKKTAVGLRDGDKYVNIILQEIKNKALNYQQRAIDLNEDKNTKEVESFKQEEKTKLENNENKSKEEEIINLEESNILSDNKKKLFAATNKDSLNRKLFDNEAKQQIIADIANKIKMMAKAHLREAQTLDEKKDILNKIENRILESSRRKHMNIHSQHTNLIAYASLIRQGLELSMKNLLTPKTRRVENFDSIEDLLSKNINASKTYFSKTGNDTSIDPLCTEVIDDLCIRVESLHKLPCGNGPLVALDQLCDGVNDCWNEADEANCLDKAISKVELAIVLMADIDDSVTNKCLHSLVDGTMLKQHHEILLTTLQSHLHTLKNYEPDFKSTVLERKADVKSIISDATKSVSSLSEALNINLCSFHEKIDKSNVSARKALLNSAVATVKTKDELDKKWSSKMCLCEGEFCRICVDLCKRLCEQKFMINRWKCKAIDGGSSISLNYICDGKSDCIDETDETSCYESSATKYEANTIYTELLDILSLKTLSVEYEQSRSKLIALSNLVRQLQKLSTNYKVDIVAIKTYRDQYFATLLLIYEDFQSSHMEDFDHIYEFLTILKEKIVDAMKRSHLGNEYMVPSTGCYCRNKTCAVLRCPQRCIATCKIEPLLTRYSCKANNESVDAKAICNGKTECPNGEDEKNCNPEVCRVHHLNMLRQNLQNVGLSLKGTSLGEVLAEWKYKALSSLIIVERHGRPNHKVMEDTVFGLLRSLVSAYASMEDNTRRTNTGNTALREFANLANIIKQTLKSCTN